MAHRCERAAQAKPVRGRDFSLSNGDEAREARLGSKQVVAIGIEISFRSAIANRKKIARAVKEKTEVHRSKHAVRPERESRKTANERAGVRSRMPDCIGQRIGPRDRVPIRRKAAREAGAQRREFAKGSVEPVR